MGLVLYSLWRYMKRAGRIHRREATSFHDAYGPPLYTLLLLTVLGLTLAYHTTPLVLASLEHDAAPV